MCRTRSRARLAIVHARLSRGLHSAAGRPLLLDARGQQAARPFARSARTTGDDPEDVGKVDGGGGGGIVRRNQAGNGQPGGPTEGPFFIACTNTMESSE